MCARQRDRLLFVTGYAKVHYRTGRADHPEPISDLTLQYGGKRGVPVDKSAIMRDKQRSGHAIAKVVAATKRPTIHSRSNSGVGPRHPRP